MQIKLSGHHVEVTDGIRAAVNNKLSKIQSHHPQLNALSVILTVERHNQSVEISTQYLGSSVAVTAANQDMYIAIADAAKKLDKSLSHKKGSSKAGRHSKPNLQVVDSSFEA